MCGAADSSEEVAAGPQATIIAAFRRRRPRFFPGRARAAPGPGGAYDPRLSWPCSASSNSSPATSRGRCAVPRSASATTARCSRVAPGMSLAVSSDMLVEGRHFVSTVAPERLGHKALAVNLSDLAACGARPLAFTLSLALPAADEAFLAPFARGLLALAERHDCELVGGDTTRGPLTIAITVFGEVASRRGAAPLGRARRRRSLGQRHARRRPARARGACAARSPWPAMRSRGSAGRWRSRRRGSPSAGRCVGIASSAIDVSDGLAGDLGHVLRRSGVGAVVEVDALPRSADLAAPGRSAAARVPARRRRRLRARLHRRRPTGAMPWPPRRAPPTRR